MASIKLLWVQGHGSVLEGGASTPFRRLCEVTEMTVGELQSPERSDLTSDAVCFEFDFPDMSGLRLLPETKARWPSIPMLLVTQQNSAELAIWALRSRVFDVLTKPFGEDEARRALERIAQALSGRRSQLERRPLISSTQPPAETRYRPQPPVAPRLHGAVAHVAKHYLRHIPESEVALLCNMSPSRFCREFKAAFDVTFVEYLSDYRMQQAKRLLANPSMPVADVAAAVGFNDPSYFTRVFRRQEGVSPSEYRAAGVFGIVGRTGS